MNEQPSDVITPDPIPPGTAIRLTHRARQLLILLFLVLFCLMLLMTIRA